MFIYKLELELKKDRLVFWIVLMAESEERARKIAASTHEFKNPKKWLEDDAYCKMLGTATEGFSEGIILKHYTTL